jgi:acyl carrier protein|tara:strand:+ start:2500 stop:2736 length:237 start_codon:yes stop_codon:yes gene_type:complete
MDLRKKENIVLQIIKKNIKLKKIDNFNLSVGQISQWDSLVHLNIFLEIKKKFNKVDINNASNVRSVKDWMELIRNIYK